MQKFKAVFKRKESPIAYFSAMGGDIPIVEKIGFGKDNQVIPIPVVKGSHPRGKFRRWLGKQVLLRNENQIKGLQDYSKRIAIATALLFSGSLTSGFKFKDDNTFNAQVKLFEEDSFGKYFGYMLTGLDNKRSSFLIGHIVPAIKGFNDDENTVAVNPETFKVRGVKFGNNKYAEITEPLTTILSSRKAPILKEITEVVEKNKADEEELEFLKKLLAVQSEGSKQDVQNLLYFEVINSGFDMVQELLIASNDEKEIEGILTAYHKYFNEVDKTLGGLSARGYGHIEEMIIEGFTPNETALNEFIDSIDLKKITDMVLYDEEEVGKKVKKLEGKQKK